MANLNRVLLIGRLTRDPELRYTAGGTAVADFGLAVNRRRKQGDEWGEEVAYVDLTAWGRTAELANQYLAKGRQVFVEGYLKFDQWTSQDGQKRSKLGVTIENMQFLDGRGGEGGSDGPGREGGRSEGFSRGQGQGRPSPASASPGDYDAPNYGDDDVPF